MTKIIWGQMELEARNVDVRCTIAAPTNLPPRKRTALTQGPDLLLKRYPGPFTYDLDNPEFRAYCIDRGVLHVAGIPDGYRFNRYFKDHTTTEADYLADTNMMITHAQEWEGKRHKYSDEHKRKLWDCVCIGRAKLQDC